MTGPEDARAADWLFRGALAVLVLHAAVAVAVGLSRFADGAWFDFALAVGEPFRLVWRNYPTRITPYLIEFLPAQALLVAHAPLPVALGTGHALWHLAPAASLLSCRRILPRERRAAALLPAIWFVLFGLLMWGFPTEVWLVGAFAWPAAFLFLYGSDLWRNAALAGALLLLALFSHEAAVLLLPLFLLIGAVRWTGFGMGFWAGRSPRNALGAALAAVAGGVLWAGVRLLVRTDPIVADSVGANAFLFFSASAFVTHPALWKYGCILLAAGLAALAARGRPSARGGVAVALAAAGLAVAVVDLGADGGARYEARSVSLLALLALGLLAVAERGAPRAWRPGPLAAVTLACLTAAASEQDARFALAWVRYDRAVAVAANCRAAPCSGPFTPLPAELVHSPAAWSWGAPFQSILGAADPETSAVVRDDVRAGAAQGWRADAAVIACRAGRWVTGEDGRCEASLPPGRPAPGFMPLNCRDAERLTLSGSRPRALRSLADLACGRATPAGA